MLVRLAEQKDKEFILDLLDEFRADCMEQVTGKPGSSDSAKTGGAKIFEKLLKRSDYCMLLLISPESQIVDTGSVV